MRLFISLSLSSSKKQKLLPHSPTVLNIYLLSWVRNWIKMSCRGMSLILCADRRPGRSRVMHTHVYQIHTRTASKHNSASFRDNNAARTNNIGEREREAAHQGAGTNFDAHSKLRRSTNDKHPLLGIHATCLCKLMKFAICQRNFIPSQTLASSLKYPKRGAESNFLVKIIKRYREIYSCDLFPLFLKSTKSGDQKNILFNCCYVKWAGIKNF